MAREAREEPCADMRGRMRRSVGVPHPPLLNAAVGRPDGAGAERDAVRHVDVVGGIVRMPAGDSSRIGARPGRAA